MTKHAARADGIKRLRPWFLDWRFAHAMIFTSGGPRGGLQLMRLRQSRKDWMLRRKGHSVRFETACIKKNPGMVSNQS
jgi:hypothetical protein